MAQRAKSGLLAATLAGLFVWGGAAVAEGLAPAIPWDIQLQAPQDFSVDVAVIDLDPDELEAADIAALSVRGVAAVCYVSVGTVEDWRSDAGAFPAEVVGKAYDGWPGERFVDIRDPRVAEIMARRFARCAEMGFAAVDPDNIDLNWADTGFAISAADVVDYVTRMAGIAHGLGLAIGQKNAPDLTGQLVGTVDFAVTEDCLRDGWCGEIEAFARAGKPVFDVEYGPIGAEACAAALKAGISVVIHDPDLQGPGEPCH